MFTKANGRDPVWLGDTKFIPENITAKRIGISIMRLRRSATLANELRAIELGCHTYYLEIKVDEVVEALSDYIIRSHMRKPPVTPEHRKDRGETILYGLTVYPRKYKSEYSRKRRSARKIGVDENQRCNQSKTKDFC